MIIETPRVFVGKHVTSPRCVATSNNTEAKEWDVISGGGRLRDGYGGCSVWVFVIFRGVNHVEPSIAWTATSDDDQYDDRGNDKGEGSKDDTNHDCGYVGSTGRRIPIASAVGWPGGSSLGAL